MATASTRHGRAQGWLEITVELRWASATTKTRSDPATFDLTVVARGSSFQ